MNKIASITVTTTVTVFAIWDHRAGAARSGARGRRPAALPPLPAGSVQLGRYRHPPGAACDQDPYTVLDHPSSACHLSEADVANWGETSAHLPLACS